MAVAGSIWVDGLILRYIDGNGIRRSVTVQSSASRTGVTGSIWVVGAYLRYMGTNNRPRNVGDRSVRRRTDAVSGSIWIQGDRIHWVDANSYVRHNHSDSPEEGYSNGCGDHSNYSSSGYSNDTYYCDPFGSGPICHTNSGGLWPTSHYEHKDDYVPGHNDCNHSDDYYPHSDNY